MIYQLVTKVQNKPVEVKEVESNIYDMEAFANRVIDVAIKKKLKKVEVIINRKRKQVDPFIHYLTVSC